MRSICLYFQVHQPFRLRTYRFFNIGDDHNYYDDYQNRQIIRRVAEKCYLPANKMMLDLIREYGTAFKVSFSISGTAIEQLQQYAPEVIQGFRQLARTGCVEFLAGGDDRQVRFARRTMTLRHGLLYSPLPLPSSDSVSKLLRSVFRSTKRLTSWDRHTQG